MTRTLAILLLATALSAAGSRTYIVERRHFSNDEYVLVPSPQEIKKFSESGKRTISEAGGQPFRLTEYLIAPNTNYALWRVTYADDLEDKRMEDYEKSKDIVLISSMSETLVWEDHRGWQKTIVVEKLADLPTDYYNVSTSTGAPQ